MGTVKIIHDTLPSLIKKAFLSYFEPLILAYAFIRNIFKEGSSSKIVLETELKKVRSGVKGYSWPSIRKDIESAARNSTQRAILRQARINWITFSTQHDEVLNALSKESISIHKIIHRIYLNNFFDLELELKKSKKELTYNILFIDEAHRATTEYNLEKYKSILNAENMLPVVIGFTSTSIIRTLNIHNEYLNLPKENRSYESRIAIKALELKIQEFLSSITSLARESTSHQ